MVSKIIKTLATVVLVIMSFSMVLSNFSPYFTSHSFQHYLLASVIFAILSLFLGIVISSTKIFTKSGFLFFLLGAIIAPPLMIGPPETSAKLLERITEENFRYGLLLLSTIIFAAGFILIVQKMRNRVNPYDKLIFIPFIISILLLVWDNYSSYVLPSELKNWIGNGNNAEDFFPQYNFHPFIRTLGRGLLYVTIFWLTFLLFKNLLIKKWQAITLCVFCTIGIAFFFLCNFVGLEFYFPFMVPAIALAPAYWLGIILITKNAK